MLPTKFQRRRLKCEKLTDNGCQVMAKAHIACGKVKNSQTTVSIKTKLNRMYFVDPQFMFCFHFSERFIHLFHSTADIPVYRFSPSDEVTNVMTILSMNLYSRRVCHEH
jgi:hypothetical protein